MTQVVSLSFFRFQSVSDRLWAFAMMGLGRRAFSRLQGIGFWKLCGSGSGEGFTPIPNTAVYAVLATWPDIETAQALTKNAHIFQRYQNRSSEHWTVFMSTSSARGAWSGAEPFQVSNTAENGALAVLTRATIKPGILMRFWRKVPNISRVIGKDPNVAFKIGIGEVPWLHQVTFSIWPDAARMSAFARTGHHAEAIKAVREEGWFREELYARFQVLSDDGSWNGVSPLENLERI